MLKKLQNKPPRARKQILILGVLGISVLVIPIWILSAAQVFEKTFEKKQQEKFGGTADAKLQEWQDLKKAFTLHAAELQKTMAAFKTELMNTQKLQEDAPITPSLALPSLMKRYFTLPSSELKAPPVSESASLINDETDI